MAIVWSVVFMAILARNVFGNAIPPPQYNTIVIGLGAAGTAASTTLARAGRRVLALEAQDRIGGRVYTVPFGEGNVELGAEWIHGTENSIVYDTAIKNNITVVPQALDLKVYQSDGQPVDEKLVNELMNFCLAAVDDPPSKPEPLGQFITKKLKDYLREKHPKVLEDQDFLTQFLNFMNLLINNYEASNDWDDVSAWSKYEELGGEQHMSWHSLGYKTFFELLMNTYNNGPGLPKLEIKLNTEVTQITWPQDPKESVQVTCKDGTVYTAENVIVTVSLGVLKERHKDLFSPMLPQEKINCIEVMPFGLLDKIILLFPHEFWPNKTTMYGFLWTETDLNRNEAWVTKLGGPTVPMSLGNVLTMWVSGETAKMVEKLPEDVVKRKCMELLRRFMGKDVTIPEPTGIIRSTWQSNPFTRGSYTYDNLEVANHHTARSDLASPLTDSTGKVRVLFAGEATHETHYSTVHGATDTGLREARRLLGGSKI